MRGFVDLHSHLLPGMDDGCQSLDIAIATAREYVNRNYSDVVVTPHNINGTAWAGKPEETHKNTQKLQQAISDRGIPLTLHAGMEIAFSHSFWSCLNAGQFLPLGNSSSYLVEFPLQPDSGNTVFEFLEGYTIGAGNYYIIAHPERCAVFQSNFQYLQLLVEKGCLIQINLGSILGRYGRASQNTAFGILSNSMCHFIGTDCHGSSARHVPTAEDLRKLEELLGKEEFEKALMSNPEYVLEGQPVSPIQPGSDMFKASKLVNIEANSVFRHEKRSLVRVLTSFFRKVSSG